MCLITFSYRQHDQYPFILVANRDEFFERPSEPMHYWPNHTEILAGQDLKLQGTWLGLHGSGRFSAVTNFRRVIKKPPKQPLSRGQLITDFLLSNTQAGPYLHSAQKTVSEYGLYNLLAADRSGLYFSSNQDPKHQDSYGRALTAGLYGLCNASLDTPWPKLLSAKQQLAQLLLDDDISMDSLHSLLNDPQPFSLELLPDTGIEKEFEQALSSQFINLEDYGTRAKTIILQDKHGKTLISETSYNQQGMQKKLDFEMQLPVFGSSANV
ncbi:MAG: NRDE family protein [Oceanospirillaceae bacterium]